MNPEQQIQRRLENAMRNLNLELKAQGIDVDAITYAFTVTWRDGTVVVEPIVSSKPKNRKVTPEDA